MTKLEDITDFARGMKMRRFANFYIVLFVVDAVYSCVDELLIWSDMQMQLLTSVRMLIAFAVIALSMIFYACLGIDRRLPKRIFLPMTIYIAWCSLGMWPLSGVVERELLPLMASVGQVSIVVLIILLMKGQLLLPASLFEKELFSMRNTMVFTGVNLLLAPLILVYTGLAMTSLYLEEQTAGFLRISPVGIHLSERSYHREDKVIRLAGMMHVGRKDYYAEISDAMSAEDAIVLAEGVTDRDNLLKHKLNYSKVAEIIGLTSQEEMQIAGNLVKLDNLDKESAAAKNKDGKPDIAHADIDINRFESSTIAFLNTLGRTLLSEKPLPDALAEYNDWINQEMTPKEIAGVMTDILDKRNEVVIASMAEALNYYDTVIIPWGALHMPAIETAVVKRGFEPGARTERLGLDFRTIPYKDLWDRWVSQYDFSREPVHTD